MSRQPLTLEQRKQKAEYDKLYRARTKEKRAAYAKAYYKIHADKIKTQVKKQVVSPEVKKKCAAKWRSKNRALCCFYAAQYLTAKLQRTPKWLTETHKAHILAYYQLAEACAGSFKMKMEVDHIVPLNGGIVSGLHVPWNMQVMTKSANASKSNKAEYESY